MAVARSRLTGHRFVSFGCMHAVVLILSRVCTVASKVHMHSQNAEDLMPLSRQLAVNVTSSAFDDAVVLPMAWHKNGTSYA